MTGESYAGVYIPTLAYEILFHSSLTNLKGVMVGDPCTDNDAQNDAMDGLWYGHKYGFVPEAQFEFLWNVCGARAPSFYSLGGKYLAAAWQDRATVMKSRAMRSARIGGTTDATAKHASRVGPLEEGFEKEHTFSRSLLGALRRLRERLVGRTASREKAVNNEADILEKYDAELLSGRIDESIPGCKSEWRKFLLQSSHAFSQSWKNQVLNGGTSFC